MQKEIEKMGIKIELLKWTKAYKTDLIELCNAADRTFLSNRMPYPYTEKDADFWLDMVAEHDGKDGIFRAICCDGKIVGNISVEQKTDVQQKDAEIGYLLQTELRSKGIMTEAVQQIWRIAFRELGLLRITGLVYAPNIASRRVLEKNGFVLEGIMRQAIVKPGAIYDLCIYGKLAQAEQTADEAQNYI